MSKPREFFYYRVIPGEMELRVKGYSRDAELILHRLIRAYFSRDREIPATPEKVAVLVHFTTEEVQRVWNELAELVDVCGPNVRIPWFDDEVRKAEERSIKAKANISKRWEGRS